MKNLIFLVVKFRISSVVLDCLSFNICSNFSNVSLDNLVILNFILSQNIAHYLLALQKPFETILKFKISANDKQSVILVITSTGNRPKFRNGSSVLFDSIIFLDCKFTFLFLIFCLLYPIKFPIYKANTLESLNLSTMNYIRFTSVLN